MDTLFDVRLYGEGEDQSLGWQGVTISRNESAYDYVAAGTAFWPDGFPIQGSGKLYVLFGGDPMDAIPDILMYGKTDSSGLGRWTRYAGDIDGDGYGDLICGAMEDPFGIAYIWLGGASMDDVPDASMRGDSMYVCVGFRVASAGDVDGDGRDEVMVSHYPASSTWHAVWVCKYTGTGIDEAHVAQPSLPGRWRISCAPNPFRGSATIRITPEIPGPLHPGAEARVSIRDLSGRLVREIRLMPGSTEAVWDGRDEHATLVPSGTYFVRLEGLEFPTQKVVLLR